MQVIKSTGQPAQFDAQKIINSLRRAGADPQLAETVAHAVEQQAYENIKTSEVYALVKQELRKRNLPLASTYDLRNALAKLGPEGFKFEQYIAAMLRAYGWKAELPEKELRGLCVDHEVDVIAEKDNETVMIEAKFRNTYGDVVTLKDVMATWSRYLDLLDGERAGTTRHFDKIWIVTNGRFTDRAEQFGVCKGIHMISWSGPSHSLARMIDHAKVYPVTVLDNVSHDELEEFSRANILLCQELTPNHLARVASRTRIPEHRLQEIGALCESITKNGASPASLQNETALPLGPATH